MAPRRHHLQTHPAEHQAALRVDPWFEDHSPLLKLEGKPYSTPNHGTMRLDQLHLRILSKAIAHRIPHIKAVPNTRSRAALHWAGWKALIPSLRSPVTRIPKTLTSSPHSR